MKIKFKILLMMLMVAIVPLVTVIVIDHLRVIDNIILDIAIVLIFSIVIVPLALIFSLTFTRPLAKLKNNIDKIAEGDYTEFVKVETKDEIGGLSDEFDVMRDHLIKLLAHTRNVGHHVDLAAESLTKHADEATASSENIARTQQKISLGAANQVKEIINTQERFLALNADIHEIKQKTDQIGQVADLIAGIAQQTNMLALNAAIEAARAGEAGRGFNVVADQVRKLADESSKAVSNTESMLKEIKTITESLENHSEEMVEMIKIVEQHSEENSAHTEEAAAAAETQSATMEEIDKEAHKLLALAEELDEELGHINVTNEDLAKYVDVLWDEEDKKLEKTVKTEKITTSVDKTVKITPAPISPKAEKAEAKEIAPIESTGEAF